MEIYKSLLQDPIICEYLSRLPFREHSKAIKRGLIFGILAVESMQGSVGVSHDQHQIKPYVPALETEKTAGFAKVAQKKSQRSLTCGKGKEGIRKSPSKEKHAVKVVLRKKHKNSSSLHSQEHCSMEKDDGFQNNNKKRTNNGGMEKEITSNLFFKTNVDMRKRMQNTIRALKNRLAKDPSHNIDNKKINKSLSCSLQSDKLSLNSISCVYNTSSSDENA
jgi:hypothetical protein